ncbi:MAG: N-acetylmuramoyl-L-alanine amidase [Lachnospiraceae bacterium]|nr:N-acetylmuramoyl-L-alanine amidase [Lachnospiraceae bacterium]
MNDHLPIFEPACDRRKEENIMKIILTVGHSILKTGNCTSADGRPYGGVLEYAYNKNIVNRVAEYLRSAGHKVDVLICPELKFSRSTDEKAYKLQRVNSGGYDLVAELHLNASVLHNARGCSVLYKSEKGKKIAQQIQSRLATVFKNNSIQKRDNLYMLNGTNPTAIMLETFFCDSSADCALAEKTDVARLIAEGIHGGNISHSQQGAADLAPSGMLYRVQTGAFTVWKNAEKMKAELQKKGFRDAFLTAVDLGQLIYRVQVGAYNRKSNAESMRQKLQAAGFDALIVQA